MTFRLRNERTFKFIFSSLIPRVQQKLWDKKKKGGGGTTQFPSKSVAFSPSKAFYILKRITNLPLDYCIFSQKISEKKSLLQSHNVWFWTTDLSPRYSSFNHQLMLHLEQREDLDFMAEELTAQLLRNQS